jgi:hypothetical protein
MGSKCVETSMLDIKAGVSRNNQLKLNSAGWIGPGNRDVVVSSRPFNLGFRYLKSGAMVRKVSFASLTYFRFDDLSNVLLFISIKKKGKHIIMYINMHKTRSNYPPFPLSVPESYKPHEYQQLTCEFQRYNYALSYAFLVCGCLKKTFLIQKNNLGTGPWAGHKIRTLRRYKNHPEG